MCEGAVTLAPSIEERVRRSAELKGAPCAAVYSPDRRVLQCVDLGCARRQGALCYLSTGKGSIRPARSTWACLGSSNWRIYGENQQQSRERAVVRLPSGSPADDLLAVRHSWLRSECFMKLILTQSCCKGGINMMRILLVPGCLIKFLPKWRFAQCN